MKKIGKKIILFFDKCLITPITKFILFITDFIKNNGREIEKFINKKQTLIVLSLIFAFIVFFIVDQNSDVLLNKNAEILYNQPVKAEYNEEAYVIEGLPSTVDVTLIGRTSDLYLAKQYTSSLSISVDLRGLTPGSHKVKLNYNQSQALKTIDYKLDPSTANIVVYEKVSETRELDYDILHKDNLDSTLILDSVDLSRNDVIIKGAEYKLKEVANVKALVDINDIKNPKVGTFQLKEEVPLIAYDSNGEPVEGIEIVPSVIDANIKITSPSKEVPIQVVPKGELAFGKSIKEFTTSISKVTIYGSEEVINSIDSIPVTIDVSNLSSSKTYNINLQKPSGVREISNKTVSVKVVLDDVITKEFEGIKVSPINLDPAYKAYAASQEDSIVTVVVKGSSDVVNKLDPNTIKATVDLKNYTPSSEAYEVNVDVTGDDLKLSYESKIKKVKIVIEEK